jgi:serine/threonine-protein kinase
MVEPGQVLDGKYRIVRLIGEGGMGAVFEGENVRISRRVAIKVLHGAALSNAETVKRFEREAQAAGRIGSEHILEILDLGVLPDGERYMVMEFLAGETLTQRIRGLGKLTPEQLAPLIRQTLVGLGAAHAAGIIHRDLKPDNLFVLKERSGLRDYVKIIDFGISKFNALGGDMSMTRTGTVMGTPYYMSPEQAKGSSQVDARSDLYAIGVIMYEALTGQVPFLADTFNELMFKIVLSDPTPVSQVLPELNPQFAAVVARAMAKNVDERFATAADMIQALDGVALGNGQGVAGSTAGVPMRPEVTQSAVLASTAGQPTQGSFTASQQEIPGLPSAKRAPVGLIAAGALLLLGGGAFAAYRTLASKSSGEAAAEAPSSASTATATPTPTGAEPAAVAQPAQPSVEPALSPPPPAAASAPASAASAAPAAPTDGPRPRFAPAKRPAPPAAGTKPAGPTSGKSTRDFGY